MYEHMLIDSRNAIYRAVYAGLADSVFMDTGHHFSVIFFRFISTYIRRFKPKNVHFFWDAPKDQIWRRKVYSEYKEDRCSPPKYKDVDVDAIVASTSVVCYRLIRAVGCRNYLCPGQEADDLIFAFCRLLSNQRTVIVSSDQDFRQVAYLFGNIDVFSPMAKDGDLYKIEEIDPVEIKCLAGEKSDNIDGYLQIGPVKALELTRNHAKRQAFFEIRGEETYLRNRALIDLSLCPYLLSNISYIQKKLAVEAKYELGKVMEIIQKYKVRGLGAEVSKALFSFKSIGDGAVGG